MRVLKIDNAESERDLINQKIIESGLWNGTITNNIADVITDINGISYIPIVEDMFEFYPQGEIIEYELINITT